MKRMTLVAIIHHLRRARAGSRMVFPLRISPRLRPRLPPARTRGAYVKQHPELNPVQRKIISSGKIPNGTAVARTHARF